MCSTRKTWLAGKITHPENDKWHRRDYLIYPQKHFRQKELKKKNRNKTLNVKHRDQLHQWVQFLEHTCVLHWTLHSYKTILNMSKLVWYVTHEGYTICAFLMVKKVYPYITGFKFLCYRPSTVNYQDQLDILQFYTNVPP